ncbi:MAG: hypothetical protein ACJAWH_001875 [Maribacter sp.]|jgi:hypothetical protein
MDKNLFINLTTIPIILLFSFESYTRADAIVSPFSGISTKHILSQSNCSPSPIVDVLGSAGRFVLFTGSGAVSNVAKSEIVGGDIGTNLGLISGFEPPTETDGYFYNEDAITAQAAVDLENGYTALMNLPNNVTDHTPTFGSGETVNAGVYFIGAAGSLAGNITLDGQNDVDAIFIFKFAGAFSIAAQSNVILINGANRCNVFWIGGAGVTTGAISVGADSNIKGTFLSHGGAISSGAGTSLEGSKLSTNGAISIASAMVFDNRIRTVIMNRSATYRVKMN